MILTVSLLDAATRIGCSERFLRQLVAERKVACTRVGRRLKFTEPQIAAILAHLEQPAQAQPESIFTPRSRGRRAS